MNKKEKYPKIETIEDFLNWLIPKLGKYTPQKATRVIEFMCEHFPCRKHNLINCPECTIEALEKQKQLDSGLDNIIWETYQNNENNENKIKEKIKKLKDEFK
jgi:hypothetical protein